MKLATAVTVTAAHSGVAPQLSSEVPMALPTTCRGLRACARFCVGPQQLACSQDELGQDRERTVRNLCLQLDM